MHICKVPVPIGLVEMVFSYASKATYFITNGEADLCLN